MEVTNQTPTGEVPTSDSRLVALRHHPSLWWGTGALLLGALLPWPYGYYDLLRLVTFAVSAWIAYEQWRHDDAVSGWVVAFGGIAFLYNPLMPIHLTREIWGAINVATAAVFLGHLRALRQLIDRREAGQRRVTRRGEGRLGLSPLSLSRRLLRRGVRPADSRGKPD